MKKNVFKSLPQNSMLIYAFSVLAAAVLLVIATFIKTNRTNFLQLILFALSIAAANYCVAVASIEKLLDRQFSSDIFTIAGVLVIFLAGAYQQAALISIIYCFIQLIMVYLSEKCTTQYCEDNDKYLYYAVKKGENYERTRVDKLNVGDVVLASKGQFLCFDCVAQTEKGNEKLYSGIMKGQDANVTITKLYDCSVDFSKLAKYSKNVSKLERLSLIFEKIYPVCVFVLGVLFIIFDSVILNFSGAKSIKPALFSGASILLLSCGASIVAGIYASYSLLLSRYKKEGLKLHGSAEFDEIAKIKNVVTNKNAVLMRGEYSVAEVVCAEGYSDNQLLSIAAAVQPSLDNAFAKAFTDKLGGAPDKMIPSKYIEHLGIIAELSGKNILVGSAMLMHRQNVDISKLPSVAVYVAVDNICIGAIRIADKLKKSSVKAMNLLKSQGIKTYVVTSDNETTAKTVAEKCEAVDYKALALSEDKSAFVNELKKTGMTAFVGDDEMSLEAADYAVCTAQTENEKYIKMQPDALMTFAKAVKGAKTASTILNVRFFGAILLNLILLVLVFAGTIGIGQVWIIALLQAVFICIPLLIAGNITFDKTHSVKK